MKVTAVVVRPQDEAVLMLPSGLPEVEVADGFWFPDVEVPLRGFREQLGLDADVLACLDNRPDATSYLMVSVGAIPSAARWVQEADDPLVAAAREHLALPADHPVTPLWTKPGWYAEALGWIDEQLDAAGSPRIGVPAQVRSWGCRTYCGVRLRRVMSTSRCSRTPPRSGPRGWTRCRCCSRMNPCC